MKKFLLGLLCGLLLAGMTMVIVAFAMVRLGERRPAVADGSTLVLKLEGPVVERAPMALPLPILEAQAPPTTIEVWQVLRRAAADRRIKAMVFMPQSVGAGWGKLDEIRTGLAQFRKSGKPLVAFLRNPRTREYYLATAADRIVMTPEDYLDMKGLRAELIFLKNTLDKLGVTFELEHAGKYKDAGDVFTRTSMSPETREVLNSVLDQVFNRLTDAVAEGRKRKPQDVAALIDEGPFLPNAAVSKGLIDALQYEDQVYEDLKKRLGQTELKKISFRDYLKGSAPGPERRKRIAVIVGEGTILRGSGSMGLGDESALMSADFIRQLRQVAGDPGVKGVIVRIDSPGGDAVASDDILREMRLLSKKKPTVISMSDQAASGGYYISMTGDPIVAYPDTYTGSIGVIYGKLNLRGLYNKLGIHKDILTRGRFAAIDSDYQPLSEEERKRLREAVQHVYTSFLARVSEARKRKADELEPLAQGRVWMGAQARERGLVDELGGLDRAVELVRQKAGIAKEEAVRLEVYPPRRGLLERLFGRREEVLLESRLGAWTGPADLRLWLQGGMLRVMPYAIRIE